MQHGNDDDEIRADHYANDPLIGKLCKSLALLSSSAEFFFLFTFSKAVSKCLIEISSLSPFCLTCSLIAVMAAAFTMAAMSAPVMPSSSLPACQCLHLIPVVFSLYGSGISASLPHCPVLALQVSYQTSRGEAALHQ